MLEAWPELLHGLNAIVLSMGMVHDLWVLSRRGRSTTLSPKKKILEMWKESCCCMLVGVVLVYTAEECLGGQLAVPHSARIKVGLVLWRPNDEGLDKWSPNNWPCTELREWLHYQLTGRTTLLLMSKAQVDFTQLMPIWKQATTEGLYSTLSRFRGEYIVHFRLTKFWQPDR